MIKTHYYPNKLEAIFHLNELKTKYNNVVMLSPYFKENKDYTLL